MSVLPGLEVPEGQTATTKVECIVTASDPDSLSQRVRHRFPISPGDDKFRLPQDAQMMGQQVLRNPDMAIDLFYVPRPGEKNLKHSQACRVGQHGKLRSAFSRGPHGSHSLPRDKPFYAQL
jgi:hypothetical protein